MFHHQTEVGSDIRLTLHGIDNHTLSLSCRRRREFNEGGKTGTAHTHDTGILNTSDDLLRSEFGMCLNGLQFV